MKLPRRIPWLAVAALAVIIPACVGALAGCASFEYDWRQAHKPAPRPWQYVTVPDIDRACRLMGSQSAGIERILGCAVWRQDGCTIYTAPNPPAWVLLHEANPDDKVPSHCGGWVHP